MPPPTMKKSPSEGQMKMLLPTSGGKNHKLPLQKKPMPMSLPKVSYVKDDLEKEQVNESSTKAINTADKNGGGGSGGGAVNTTAKEESNENAILPSPEDLKDICGGLPENAQVSSTLYLLQRKRKKGCGVTRSVWRVYFIA